MDVESHLPRIGIIGAGVVGSATGRGFSKLGHDVLFYDTAIERLSLLMQEGFHVTNNIEQLISETEMSFVCVGTPTTNGRQDLSQLMSVTSSLAEALELIKTYHLVVYRSTVLPGSIRNNVLKYLDKNCDMKRGSDYNVCYNPEFLRQATSLNDFLCNDRIVIGEDVLGSSIPLSKIYGSIASKILVTSLEAAEMIKCASNCFLALKISFFNEIGLLCSRLGIDSKDVGYGVSLDKRIGSYGTKFGEPFAGACLPKDAEAFATLMRELDMEPDLMRVALEINEKIQESGSLIHWIRYDINSTSEGMGIPRPYPINFLTRKLKNRDGSLGG